MTRPVNKQTNRLIRLHKLDPLPDGDCLLHALNFNILTKALTDTLSLDTERGILASGYIRELKAAARAHGIKLRIPKSAQSLREKLIAILHALTIEDPAHLKGEQALMQAVHWGVWQKISGMALRKLANHALQRKPHIIEPQLYSEFLLALSQQVLQARYPENHFPTSTDRFDDLFKTPACQQLIATYLQHHQDLFPEHIHSAADLSVAEAAIVPLTALAVDGDASQCDPDIQDMLQDTWRNVLFPQWLATHANEEQLDFEMLGDEHCRVLGELWKVNFLQIDQNPRLPQANLTSLNATPANPAYDHFVVQRSHEHYVAGITLGDKVVESLIEAVVADREIYDATGNQVESRFGCWDQQGFTPAVVLTEDTLPASAPTLPLTSSPITPVVHFVEDEQTQALFRHAIAQELQQRAATPALPDPVNTALTAQGSAVQLQLELDEALADYIQTHQPDDNIVLTQALQNAHTPAEKKAIQHTADVKLEHEFYQYLATTKEVKYGSLYQRVGLLGRQLQTQAPGAGTTALDSTSTSVTDFGKR